MKINKSKEFYDDYEEEELYNFRKSGNSKKFPKMKFKSTEKKSKSRKTQYRNYGLDD